MKLMLRYTLRYKKLLLFDFISVFGFILIELGLPTILAMMIDKGIGNNDFNYVQKMGIIMIAITVVGIVMSISLRYFSSQITSRMVAAIRDDLFEKVQTFSHTEYEQ
ncbi:MAG: ABC transporter ATP-binding protein, partial [Enterococcus hulanensis]